MSEETITQELATPEPEVTEEEVVEAEPTEEEEVVKTGDESVSVEEIVTGVPPKKAKKGGVQERIDELTRLRYEEKRRADALEAQLKTKIEAPVLPSGRPIPPTEGEFIDPEDFRKARIKYEDDLDVWKSHSRINEEVQNKQKQELESNVSKFNANAARMREKYPDFDKAVNEPLFSPEMSSEIMGSDLGPEIGYYLAKNPAEALKLSKLSPTGIAKEIGKLENKFTQAQSKITTQAPEPLSPLKGDDAVKKDPSKMTTDEWMAWDKQRALERIKQRGVI